MKYFALIIIIALTASSVFAESNVRIRGLQASPLLSDNAEKGKFKSGSDKVKMNTPPSEYQSFLISYGGLALGKTSITTLFSLNTLDYTFLSEWLDAALIFNGPGNTSISIGTGVTSSGKGLVVGSSGEFKSQSLLGTSWFSIFALEYDLPINLDFIGLKFTEILLGYRENILEYKEFEYENEKINSNIKFKSIQYQFGIGLVF